MKRKLSLSFGIRVCIYTIFFLTTVFNKALAQSSYNADYNPVIFMDSSKVHKVGTDGTSAGDITLYTNVITIGDTTLDCIVKTVSISGGSFTLPSSPASGTSPFDYKATSAGGSLAANTDEFFSPMFSWNSGGGSCEFEFQFIEHNSYNNSTNTGSNVSLVNMYMNSYDIDGNGGSNSNQFNEINNFENAVIKGTGSNLDTSFNSSSGATRFTSQSSSNTANVTDEANRFRLYFDTVSTISVIVGAGGSGAAYYFMDFSQGPVWSDSAIIMPLPVELIEFQGKRVENSQVQLSWTTASETNNSHFEIERNDGKGSWVNIGSIAGYGNSTELIDYSFTDVSASASEQFYRIKQIDFDGAFEYSNVVRVAAFGTSSIGDFVLSPNPTRGKIHVATNHLPGLKNIEFSLYNDHGQLVSEEAYSRADLQSTAISLDLTNLDSGVYYLKLIQSNGEVQVKRLVKI